MTITPDASDGRDRLAVPDRPTGWWLTLLTALEPALYHESWKPWIRIVLSGVLLFVALVVWHLIA